MGVALLAGYQRRSSRIAFAQSDLFVCRSVWRLDNRRQNRRCNKTCFRSFQIDFLPINIPKNLLRSFPLFHLPCICRQWGSPHCQYPFRNSRGAKTAVKKFAYVFLWRPHPEAAWQFCRRLFPRTMESSTKTTRFPFTLSTIAESFMLTWSILVDWPGEIKVLPIYLFLINPIS